MRASSTATVEAVVTDSERFPPEDQPRTDGRAAFDADPEAATPEAPAEPVGERTAVLLDAAGTGIGDLPYATDDGPDLTEGKPVEADGTGKHRRLQSGLEWAAVVIGALVVALVVKTFLFQAFYIPSASMEPTLSEGDRVLVNKISYDLHDVHRGDVIVFELDDEDVGTDGIKDLIKRVVGLPGDVIETRDGVVYVNDRALDEPYLADGTITGDPSDPQNPAIERRTVPEGHVFVLGDNRSNSADSRYPDRGPIPIDTIVGRAFVLVWPPGDIGTL